MRGWTSVGDELPEIAKEVLIFTKLGDFMLGFLTHDCIWLSYDGVYQILNAEYWMPLPEPPVIEGSEQ